VCGFLGFDAVAESHEWNEDAISILTIVGESFANALDRRLADQTLRESELRFKDFADIAADWFWEVGPDLTYTYLSERYQDIMGVAPARHLGLACKAIFADQVDDHDKWAAYLDDLRERRPFDIELAWVRPDSTSRVVRQMGRPRFDARGAFLGYRGVGRDVTDAHRMSAQIAHQASHDALTGLVNRREFGRRLERAVANAQQHASHYVLGYLDLDRFKVVNDVAGHAAGDVLLKRAAGLLAGKIRRRDTLARLGGDEFGLLLENCPLDKALEISDAMLNELGTFRFSWEDQSFDVGVSIGLVSINVSSETPSRVLAHADLACYTAKRLGKNRVHVYRMDDGELARRRTEIRRIGDLREALAKDRFVLYYQPIVPLGPGSDGPARYELLLRMTDEAGKVVLPDVFVPPAERYGLMAPIDRWVVHTAFRDGVALFSLSPGAGLAINLSGNSLNDESLLAFIQGELDASGMPPERVCFEITETAAIHNFEQAARFMATMRELGCRFALDDFGSGLSSFAYLKHLPVDYLKIDGSFVRDMTEDSVDRAMVAAIHEVGRIMGMSTIAECADTDAVIAQLRELGVDYVQGDAVGAAAPLHDAVVRSGQAEEFGG